ncbi:hypothetical protein A3I99_02030 [Candidatus Kaiserbacteria bacterium RIFCSPLOWO2_02_FULL_45_11b]|uniref:Uncharacterized protein n=1 Tax=Candidatus Kaiserbacteria bacterium RIFCSPLOWO2_12_FULL_45_26 TaxID=1798525 RepID=A0A1F6FHJ9_9BACT|nr:MAG: hypothetical protein A2Z56_04835 [Candidatus Kaiserbacteria bacterium RIFCSPHIGHO2_12_45_16]OGG70174.1 MAG: hypothetical protein A2929_03770 [Candidatus Kaiserbacteria bacterium RIFCSPLOWO2_01_FULL_45_25]OGG81843.1 MAG: hypothetical protein A3I99_02030 [Candidatus Kaiserbacteria bacterium RIFCSPLOWO2_02_FULL_45_11b]OGG85345.1 MAG: hypothetical protein A3G90_04830 [Candidatus Kaiserbacteria bacterium RIFCSPLOWO2_12_FULL_45_26]
MKNLPHRTLQTVLPNWAYERLNEYLNSEGLRRYASNTAWALAAKIFSVIMSFFVTIYLVRYLGPENYGNLSYAVSFVGIFSVLSTLGIDNVLYRELIVYPEKRNEYLGSAFLLKLSAGFIACVFTIFGAIFFATDDVSQLIIIMLAATFIFNSFNVVIYEFQANVKQKYPSLVSLAVVFILNLLKLSVIALDQGIIYIGGILLLESVLYATFFIFIRIRHYGTFRDWTYNKTIAVSILRDSWPFIFIALFASVYARIDQVMLKHLIDSSAVGIYDAAVRIAEVWLFVPGIIASSLFPAIVNGKKTSVYEYKKRLLNLTIFLVIIAGALATFSSFIAKPLIHTLYGPAFIESAGVFTIYIWSGVFVSISLVLHYFLLAENKRKVIFFSSLGTMITNIALNVLLIPVYGITGAALATLISYAILILPIILIFKLK